MHLGLYRYWLAKRGQRRMPARADIDPTEIPQLLAYISIVHKVEDEYRYRLVGTMVANQRGRDLTGDAITAYTGGAPESASAVKEVSAHIFTFGRPLFVTGEYEVGPGDLHHASAAAVPLSNDDREVNMVMFTHTAYFPPNTGPSADWLRDAHLRLTSVAEIEDTTHLERLCRDWERLCLAANTHHRGGAKRFDAVSSLTRPVLKDNQERRSEKS